MRCFQRMGFIDAAVIIFSYIAPCMARTRGWEQTATMTTHGKPDCSYFVEICPCKVVSLSGGQLTNEIAGFKYHAKLCHSNVN